MARVYAEVEPFRFIPPHAFVIPNGLVQMTVCSPSGMIAGPRCPKNEQFQEIFLAEQAPQMYDNAWVTLPIDRNNGLLANDRCPPDIVEMQSFMKMPDDVRLSDTLAREWAIAHGIAQPPTESSPCAQ